MTRIIGLLSLSLLLTSLSGCSYLFYPHAKDFAEKAKDANHVQTLINLTNMMEASAKAARNGKGYDQALNDLHNQFHAFDDRLCCAEKETREKPAHALAVTHNKELWAIFKRLWKFKDDQPQREQHLDLFATEVKELRDTLQTLK
jgi:CHASE3 domain sensor protein